MEAGDKSLLEQIAAVAREVPASVLEAFCERLARGEAGYHVHAGTPVPTYSTRPEVQHALRLLVVAWQESGHSDNLQALAWAIRAATTVDEGWRKWQTLELIWSGPTPGGGPLRRTDQALMEVVHAAEKRITIVTFAAFKVPNLALALCDAAHRGVAVRLIMETKAESGGKITHDPLQGLGPELAALAEVYVWPFDQRAKDAQGHHGSLHVKCAVADGERLLLSSANLTEFAFNLNMEMGLLVTGGPVPYRVEDHFADLISKGVLQRVAGAGD